MQCCLEQLWMTLTRIQWQVKEKNLFMNIVLLDPRQTQSELWTISAKRQVEHLTTHVDVQVGDTLKVGIREGKRYLTQIVSISDERIQLKPLQEESVPAKHPVTLIVAMHDRKCYGV